MENQPRQDVPQGDTPQPQPQFQQPGAVPPQPAAQPLPPPTFQPVAPQPEPQPQPRVQPQQWQPPTAAPEAPTFAPPLAPSVVKQPNKKLIVMIAVGAAAVIAIGVGAYFMFFNGGNSLLNVLTGTAEVVDRSDGKLDLGNLIDNQQTIKEQSIKGKINQQLNLSSGTSYMVTGIDRNVTSTSSFVKAGPGKELIKVNIVVGNRDKDSAMYVATTDFQLRNSAGGLQTPEFVTPDEIAGALDSQELASGKQIKGALVFEVDKGEKVSALITDDKYRLYGSGASDKEVSVKSEVTLN